MAVAPKQIPALVNAAEAQAALRAIRDTIVELTAVVVEESRLVGAAKLREASPLAARKSELSKLYVAGLDVIKANAAVLRRILPAEMAALKTENEALQHELELNLAVLATAHAVAEGIIRGVSQAVERRRAPAVYGANGRSAAPAAFGSRPIAVSRTL
ncbi:hypothetical protein E8L99_21125 [Phreatobacter aquaticus]|uniref:Flagellar basal-body protein FlbY n=1 Tax=Phreatobacter aquaticus TaxID=2570229 RepID=A0A4D7QRG2_9HYPH|nr:hypothetical protein [Phreatobacter aquaticus]QCK88079.1 hypothetical protein E8L99_21125 [Phreatobacter aquaticus]